MGQAWEVSSEATGWLLVTGPSPVGGLGGGKVMKAEVSFREKTLGLGTKEPKS